MAKQARATPCVARAGALFAALCASSADAQIPTGEGETDLLDLSIEELAELPVTT